MWMKAEVKDESYEELCETVWEQHRSFLTVLRVRVSITKCSLNDENKLLFQERHWVSDSKSLCIRLIQYTHGSTMIRHFKRDVTDELLFKQFFWPEMLQDVCTFCRNCDKCHTNNSWKNCRQGFLKPLPVLKRVWRKIFIDFVVNLPLRQDCMNLLIIINCLSKRVILKPCNNMSMKWVAETFIWQFYWAHDLSTTIVLN